MIDGIYTILYCPTLKDIDDMRIDIDLGYILFISFVSMKATLSITQTPINICLIKWWMENCSIFSWLCLCFIRVLIRAPIFILALRSRSVA